MKTRIAIWAAAGALVVVFWTLYVSGSPTNSLSGALSILVDLTCPIALAGNHALSFGLVQLVNAATYALIGAVVEFVRRRPKPVPFPN
jgi:hypothetical protein